MYTIYGTPGCTYCAYAKQLVDNKGLDFKYVDLSEDQYAREMFKENGFRTVPQIYHDGNHIGGYDELAKSLKD